MKFVSQFVAYALFAVVVGLFSVWPRYALLDPQEAFVSLAFSHAGERIGECRRLTQEELNELPPNMRKPDDCPRARHPLFVQLKIDRQLLYETLLQPSGLWQDGKSNVYQRIRVDAGEHNLFVGMRDSGRQAGFDYTQEIDLVISPGQNLLVGFDATSRRFKIQ